MKIMRNAALTLILIPPTLAACAVTPNHHQADVVVYGGTPAGITAAIAAAREGASVMLLEQTRHVGGMSSSGLNRDESEHMFHDETFGGLADRFFATAAERSGSNPKSRAKVWHSGVAEQVFLEMLKEAEVTVYYEQRAESARIQGAKITSLTTTTGATYHGHVYIDATYEGDLMAAAGVTCVTGRESQEAFGESLGGVIYPDKPINVSPYDSDGHLLPGVMPGPPPPAGAASPHPTPYNIRMNLTTVPENRVEIHKPKDYDSQQYELLARCIEAGILTRIGQVLGLYGMPGGKVECNNRQFSIVSMSIPGAQTPWSTANYEQRETIYQAYRDYTHGLIWFLKSDPRIPESMRKDMARYGLCQDEWTDNGHWPWQLYVREARRLRGRYVLTQKDIIDQRTKYDVIHLCSHWIDSHQAARHAVNRSSFVNEGRLWQRGRIYQFPYRAITPIPSECENLLVPVCVSASHVAFCSVRVEPTWMHLGEAAGIAAYMAVKEDVAVQGIHVPRLQQRLRALKMPLDLPESP